MKLYLDTSALVKMVVREPESSALTRYLTQFGDDLVFTCALARTELVRAAMPAGPDVVARAGSLLDSVDTVALTRGLLDTAGTLQPPALRSLDAIHLSAALRGGATLRAVVTYDRRMTSAAEKLGLAVASPA